MRRKIPAWPVAGGAAFVFTAALVWLIYLVSFVDGRWQGFMVADAIAVCVLWSITGVFALEAVEIPSPGRRRRKPRGWRKLRREAEERAYIRDLERELGL